MCGAGGDLFRISLLRYRSQARSQKNRISTVHGTTNQRERNQVLSGYAYILLQVYPYRHRSSCKSSESFDHQRRARMEMGCRGTGSLGENKVTDYRNHRDGILRSESPYYSSWAGKGLNF